MKKTNMIFSPHPDDACLGCGGIISQKIKSGENVIIVDITDGRNPFLFMFGIEENPTPTELEDLRKKEEINGMKILGVPKENIYFLDYEDGFLCEKKEEAGKEVLEIIKKNMPSEIYIPALEDKHLDHILTNILIKESLRKLNYNGSTYEYFIWSRQKIEKSDKKDIIKIDISNELSTKKEALQAYKSQVTKISSKQKTPILEEIFVNYFLQNKELFRKVDSYEPVNFLKFLPISIKMKFVTPIANLKFKDIRKKQ